MLDADKDLVATLLIGVMACGAMFRCVWFRGEVDQLREENARLRKNQMAPRENGRFVKKV